MLSEYSKVWLVRQQEDGKKGNAREMREMNQSKWTLPKNLIVRTHPSRCPDVNAGSGGLLSQNSVRAEDGMGSTRMQLDRRKERYGS